MSGVASVVIKGLLGLAPVLLFLVALLTLDSFKLVRLRSVLLTILVGGLVALVALAANRAALSLLEMELQTYTRYGAPVVEEILKAGFLFALIRRGRIGFLVDAAIHGFAIGAGFAVVENLEYMRAMGESSLWLWVVRGFGTALLHGSATAMVGIVARDLVDRHDSESVLLFVPALLAAIGVHSAYNHALLPPMLSTLALLVVLPVLVLAVYSRSEKATREWLGVGLDSDAELLQAILEGEVAETRAGRYLTSLKARFPGAVVGDMLCFLQIHLELSMRAKGLLLAREAGLQVDVSADVRANLDELRYLEKSIGATGRQALEPILSFKGRDLWQIYLLGK